MSEIFADNTSESLKRRRRGWPELRGIAVLAPVEDREPVLPEIVLRDFLPTSVLTLLLSFTVPAVQAEAADEILWYTRREVHREIECAAAGRHPKGSALVDDTLVPRCLYGRMIFFLTKVGKDNPVVDSADWQGRIYPCLQRWHREVQLETIREDRVES